MDKLEIQDSLKAKYAFDWAGTKPDEPGHRDYLYAKTCIVDDVFTDIRAIVTQETES